MREPNEPVSPAKSAANETDLLQRLQTLGPEAQGETDESVIRDNLALTPFQRLQAMSNAATQIEQLRKAMKAADHG